MRKVLAKGDVRGLKAYSRKRPSEEKKQQRGSNNQPKAPQPAQAPARTTATEVFSLRTEEEVLLLCRMLMNLKRKAPSSLTFTVAVTAEREVQLRKVENGHNREQGDLLRNTLQRVSAKILQI